MSAQFCGENQYGLTTLRVLIPVQGHKIEHFALLKISHKTLKQRRKDRGLETVAQRQSHRDRRCRHRRRDRNVKIEALSQRSRDKDVGTETQRQRSEMDVESEFTDRDKETEMQRKRRKDRDVKVEKQRQKLVLETLKQWRRDRDVETDAYTEKNVIQKFIINVIKITIFCRNARTHSNCSNFCYPTQ